MQSKQSYLQRCSPSIKQIWSVSINSLNCHMEILKMQPHPPISKINRDRLMPANEIAASRSKFSKSSSCNKTNSIWISSNPNSSSSFQYHQIINSKIIQAVWIPFLKTSAQLRLLRIIVISPVMHFLSKNSQDKLWDRWQVSQKFYKVRLPALAILVISLQGMILCFNGLWAYRIIIASKPIRSQTCVRLCTSLTTYM